MSGQHEMGWRRRDENTHIEIVVVIRRGSSELVVVDDEIPHGMKLY